MTALCGLAGSVIRPLGGYVADLIGGLASLRVVLPFIVLTVASIGYLPPLEWCVPFMIVAVGMMGFGNGAVFQIVSHRFHSQIGLASGFGGGGRPRRVFRADCVGHLERHDGNVSHRILAVWRCRRDRMAQHDAAARHYCRTSVNGWVAIDIQTRKDLSDCMLKSKGKSRARKPLKISVR